MVVISTAKGFPGYRHCFLPVYIALQTGQRAKRLWEGSAGHFGQGGQIHTFIHGHRVSNNPYKILQASLANSKIEPVKL